MPIRKHGKTVKCLLKAFFNTVLIDEVQKCSIAMHLLHTVICRLNVIFVEQYVNSPCVYNSLYVILVRPCFDKV